MRREDLFLSELALIRRVVAWTCARHSLRGADAEDFGSSALLRFIENDYGVLARFEGKSSLKTYLTAVVQRLYLDFQAQRFGKWRPSAKAKRLGPVALSLERLLYRDGLTFDEAFAVLRSEGAAESSRDALYATSQALPRRVSRKPITAEAPHPAHEAETLVEQQERQALADRVFLALRRSLARVPANDRLFLRLHLDTGMTVAEIAAAWRTDQKALYRRKDAVYKHLRADLFQEGIGRQDVRELLDTLDWHAALTVEPSEAAAPSHPHGSSTPLETGEPDLEKGSQ